MLPEMPLTVALQGGGCGSGILWMLSLLACVCGGRCSAVDLFLWFLLCLLCF